MSGGSVSQSAGNLHSTAGRVMTGPTLIRSMVHHGRTDAPLSPEAEDNEGTDGESSRWLFHPNTGLGTQ